MIIAVSYHRTMSDAKKDFGDGDGISTPKPLMKDLNATRLRQRSQPRIIKSAQPGNQPMVLRRNRLPYE